MPSSNPAAESFDVVILGGGNAGIATAAHLRRRGVTDIAIVEPSTTHTYRPLLSYVGGGQASLSAAQRAQRSVTPPGCTWVHDTVTAIEPAADDGDHMVVCRSGRRVGGRDLIIATGLVPDHDALPGISAALATRAVASNYLDGATRTWAAIQELGTTGGHAVFTVPRPPVSCTATTLKPLFLGLAHWKSVGTRVSTTLLVDRPALTGVTELDATIDRALADRGVTVFTETAVRSVDAAARSLGMGDSASRETTLDYDFLHLVPPYRAHRFIADAGLAGNHAGLVDVDPATFAHTRHRRIWSLGDCADLGTDPSGGALRTQAPICADNIVATRAGTALGRYDGYTVAPVTIDSRRAILGEFNRRNELEPSLPSFIDPLRPRRTTWAFDRYALPQIYWNLILRARA